MKIKLAEALLRRKELNQKLEVLKNIKANALFEVRFNRVKVTDSLDEITANVPILTSGQVTHEYDYHARQLREIDALIQQANWTCEIDAKDEILKPYEAPKELLVRKATS